LFFGAFFCSFCSVQENPDGSNASWLHGHEMPLDKDLSFSTTVAAGKSFRRYKDTATLFAAILLPALVLALPAAIRIFLFPLNSPYR
jgi:hypothetical protein